MKALLYSLASLASLLPLVACKSAETLPPETPPAEVWIDLFDGETTAGWRGYRQESAPPAWKAVDGALMLDKQEGVAGGDLITEAQYANFELELEWKISPGGNSGIFYRATEETDIIYENSAEMQVLDNEGTGFAPTDVHGAGANYALHAPPEDFCKPAGEWNHVRILADGTTVKHWLNGGLVCEFELYSPEWEALVAASKFSQWPPYGRSLTGHIGLQDHGNPVWYRNIRLRELP